MKTLLFLFLAIFTLLGQTFEQSFNIQTINPKIKTIKSTQTYFTNLAYDESKLYDISLRFNGFIQNLQANEHYKYIKKGEQIFDVYSKEIFDLQYELHNSNNINKNIQETLVLKLKLFDFDDKTIDKIIKAPTPLLSFQSKYSGYIIEKNIIEGSFAPMGKTLLKLANIDTLWAIAKVYQKDIANIKVGMEATINVEGLTKSYTAKVDKIYPNINTKDMTYDVRLIVPNPNHTLFPNMFAKATILSTSKEALSLPKEAVIKRDNKLYVFKKTGEREYEPIEIQAEYKGGYFEIFSGISANESVVKNALFLLDSDAVTNGLYNSDW